MRRAIAVFDIDGTILTGTSSERIFVRYLLWRRELSLAGGASFIIRFLTTFWRSWTMATKGNKSYLKGKCHQRINELAGDCFREEIVPRISPAARLRMEEHRACGLEIVLLSGTPAALLRCFQQHLGADHAHGSTLKVSHGRYTGEVCGAHPYGRAKVEIVQANYAREPYDLSSSYAYADHITDFEFLRLFGHPFLVNPSARLTARAGRAGIAAIRF